jgi:hypothetical protein
MLKINLQKKYVSHNSNRQFCNFRRLNLAKSNFNFDVTSILMLFQVWCVELTPTNPSRVSVKWICIYQNQDRAIKRNQRKNGCAKTNYIFYMEKFWTSFQSLVTDMQVANCLYFHWYFHRHNNRFWNNRGSWVLSNPFLIQEPKSINILNRNRNHLSRKKNFQLFICTYILITFW